MKQIALLIKPASSSCNLRCSYCFYSDLGSEREQANYGIMNEEVAASLIDKTFCALDEDGTAVFSFQGGEPVLAGLDWFIRFTELVDKRRVKQTVRYALQTNGTLIDDAGAAWFQRPHFLIGVSLDGLQANMDRFRYDANKKGVMFQVLRGIACLKKRKVEFNILTVVTQSLARSPKALYEYMKKNHFDYIQLIPCLPSLTGMTADEEALTPKLYAEFFLAFFDCWYRDARQGKMIEVNLFSNLLEMLSGRPPYQCGMLGRCSLQYVVEADGSVYPCDFFVLDRWRLGNCASDSFETMSRSALAAEFLNSDNAENALCFQCRYRRFCRGGCRRQNVCYLQEDYCGYQALLDGILPRLESLL